MAILRRNEPVAARRRVSLFVNNANNDAPVSRGTDFSSALYLDPGTGSYAAADGTLTNKSRPLQFTDLTVSAVSTSDNTLTSSSHGLEDLDGPVQVSSTGTLPTGLSASTDYYVIRDSDDAIKLASSLANAIAETAIDITGAGSGTIKIVDTDDTIRYLDGQWYYEFTQDETDVDASELTLCLLSDSYYADPVVCDMQDSPDTLVIDGPRLVKSETTATKRVIAFPWFDAAGKAATSAPAATEVQIHKYGGSWANVTNDPALVSSQGGAVELELTAAELGTAGPLWLRVVKDGFRTVLVRCFVSATNAGQDVFGATAEGDNTYGDAIRGIYAVLCGLSSGYTSGTVKFYRADGTTVAFTFTETTDGRTAVTVGDLT